MTTQVLCAALLLTQAPNASLRGTVRDSERGSVVQGATVELVDGSAWSITDDAGHYLLKAVPTGPRHLRVSGLGYQSRTLHVFVPANGVLQVDVALLPAPIPLRPLEASVDTSDRVRGAMPGGDRVRRVGSRSITYDELRGHPMLAEPDFLEVLGGGSVLVDPESPNGLHVRGGSSDQNLFAVDGIPVFSPYHGLGQFSAIGPDAIGRVELHAGVPPVAWGDALSSVVDLQTRKPGSSDVGLRGAVTATGARLTADGPLAIGAGFLVSGGWTSPGFLAPSSEDSYVRGSFTHSLAKLEWPLEIGLVRVLGFQSDNALRMRSVPASDAGGETLETGSGAIGSAGIETMNRFSWHSRSYGLVWEKPIGQRAIIDARLWHSSMDAVADWLAVESSLEMSGRRRNLGSRLRLTVDGEDARSLVGLSLERDRTAYAVRAAASGLVSGDPAPSSDLRARGIVFAAFAEHQRLLLRRVQLLMGLRGSGASGDDLRMAPRLSVHWPISTLFSVSAGCARTYQRVQSLRNPESLLENIFSPELPIHVGADGVPTARADQLALALEAHPAPGMRVGLETFTRALDGLILVAPNTGLPFAAGGFSLGSSEAWGIGVDLELRRARYRTLATYGFASVTNEMWDSEYRPSFATTHLITTGAVYYPAKEVELRSALRAEIGRPTTLMEGPFVWEPCSVLEGGCEAEGSPQRLVGPLGGHGLPAYVRVDIGGRKHWHARVLGREGTITAYATLSNVFGRRNVLGYVSDPLTGERSAIPMRPFSPLTAGLEWRF